MTDRELMQQALEALEGIQWPGSPSFVKAAITALRDRLAQPEQEPVCAHGIGKTKCSFCHQPQPEQEPVAYTLNCVCGAVWDIKADGSEEMAHTPDTTPPQRKPWVGLTDEQIRDLWSWSMTAEAERTANTQQHAFARAIEAAHGIKGEA